MCGAAEGVVRVRSGTRLRCASGGRGAPSHLKVGSSGGVGDGVSRVVGVAPGARFVAPGRRQVWEGSAAVTVVGPGGRCFPSFLALLTPCCSLCYQNWVCVRGSQQYNSV